uniref:Uncharacterized protein n=1 Tax=Angiostrongylus cantonensis TaxID=6313 RepID=A0A0K0D8E2_ANGCA
MKCLCVWHLVQASRDPEAAYRSYSIEAATQRHVYGSVSLYDVCASPPRLNPPPQIRVSETDGARHWNDRRAHLQGEMAAFTLTSGDKRHLPPVHPLRQ